MAKKESITLCEDIRERVAKSGQDRNELLRGHLSGLIMIECEDSSEKAYIEFKGEELEISDSNHEAPSCSLKLSRSDLDLLMDGDLNPQVALLSDKVKASGDMTLAMYVCNLFSRES